MFSFVLHELGLYMVRNVVEIDGKRALIEKIYALHTDLCILFDSFLPWLFSFRGFVLIQEHFCTVNAVSLMWLIHLCSYDIL